MKGKSITIPYGLMFKKYYCAHCGNKLEKVKTHRVVTKDDKDYYQYQPRNTFPRRDHDVYDYELKCPCCHRRVSFREQCILERIQKKYRTKQLTKEMIRENYITFENKEQRRVLLNRILIPAVILIVCFGLYFLLSEENNDYLIYNIIFLIVVIIIIIVGAIKKNNGSYKTRYRQTYSYKEETLYEKLHAYSSSNKDLIEESTICYCFHCQKKMDSKEIVNYLKEGSGTALCPYCGVDAILPDSVEEEINDEIITGMNKYWF